MTLHAMSKDHAHTSHRLSRAGRFFEALRLLPSERVRAGAPVHSSLRHLAGDTELTRY
jgi:hypothetical protein